MNLQELLNYDKDYRQVKVAIGGDGKEYHSSDTHFQVTGAEVSQGQVVFLLPDSVAEYFRQEGRRLLQSELRGLLNASRA
jgi:hypothetical protein